MEGQLGVEVERNRGERKETVLTSLTLAQGLTYVLLNITLYLICLFCLQCYYFHYLPLFSSNFIFPPFGSDL